MEETEGGEEGKGRKGGRGISSASRLDQRQNERKEGDDGHTAKKKICTARASERASTRRRGKFGQGRQKDIEFMRN